MRPKRYWALVSQMRHKLRRALESAGVEFIDENGGGPGVRLPKAPREEELGARTTRVGSGYSDRDG
jgi:hypothetical protein